MKTTRLPPDTDLARIAPLSSEEKRLQLLRFKAGYSNWSYDPTRKAIPDLVNASGSLFRSTGDTPLRELEARIRRDCKGNVQGIVSNLEVARLAYEDHRRYPIDALQQTFGRYYIGPGESVAYWSDIILVGSDGRPLVPCYDFRRANGLTVLGARFAASIANLHISANYPEYADARLLLIQFPTAGGIRSIRSRILDVAQLFTYDELNQMVGETRAIWDEINDERTDEARRTGTSGSWWS